MRLRRNLLEQPSSITWKAKSVSSNRTAETYQTTLNSFKRFRGDCDLPLHELTPDTVESYQYYLKHSNVILNTIFFYMRRLRACYNRAVEEAVVPACRMCKYAYAGMDKTMKRA